MISIAASTLAFLNQPVSQALEKIGSLGFEGVEIYYEGEHALPVRQLLDELSAYDFAVFLHAPFSDLNLASFNRVVHDESMKQIKASLHVASAIDARVVTVHFGRYSPLGLSYPEAAKDLNKSSVASIAGFGESLGLNVAFENAPKGFGAMFGPLDMIEELVNELGIGLTLDMGHANTWDEGIDEFIRRLNKAITHIHAHDNTGETDMHLALGEGGIDFISALRSLDEINYKKTLCLEILYEEDLEKSMNRINGLLGD